jgi:hypothetical protein
LNRLFSVTYFIKDSLPSVALDAKSAIIYLPVFVALNVAIRIYNLLIYIYL